MSPRTIPAHELPPAIFDAAECAGCGCDTDPDSLCDACRERREETAEHHPDCRCGDSSYGCIWHLATDAKLRAWGVR